MKDKNKDIKHGASKNTKEAAPKRVVQEEQLEKAKTVHLKRGDYESLKEGALHSEEFKDKYLRAHAEIDNVRKRFAKEKEEYIKFANEDLLSEVLYIVDNFDRALGHMNGTQKVDAILEGINMIRKQFHNLLERKGLKKIEAVGKIFDPALHEAVEYIETEEGKDHIVLEELQAGYLLSGRLLRPAVVKVGKKIK
jgi:molecular chaperone GrpE